MNSNQNQDEWVDVKFDQKRLISNLVKASNVVVKLSRKSSADYIFIDKLVNPKESKIHEEYEFILRKCIFVSKGDVFDINSTTSLGSLSLFYHDNSLFQDNSGTFFGLIDGVMGANSNFCNFSGFSIYDEYFNDISKLTLNEYKSLLRENKINKIIQSDEI